MQAELFIFSLIIYQVFSICSPKNAFAVWCPAVQDIFYKWEVKESSGSVVQTATTPSIRIDGYSFSSESVFQINYTLKVTISHHSDMRESSSFSDSFRFTPDNMHIEINGGVKKSHPANKDLEIDARTLSRDTSYPPSEDAFQQNVVEWTLEPNIPGFVPSNSLVLRVPSSYLKLGQVYKSTVKVRRTKIPYFMDLQSASQHITITEAGTPELNIECIKNCKQPHPKENTAVRAVCVHNCHNLNYVWTINPSVSSENVNFDDGELLIKPGVFEEGENVTISVRSARALSSYYLPLMSKMKKGVCDITPKSGISGITAFKVHCTGFFSPNGKLRYIIYQRNEVRDENVILSDEMSLEETHVFLSEGEPVKIVVKVRDNLYIEEEINLTVDAKPFSPKNNVNKLDVITRQIQDEESESVVSLSLNPSRVGKNKIIQKVSYLLTAMDTLEIDYTTKVDLHNHMARSLGRIRPSDFTSVSQIISILTKLEAFRHDTDIVTARLIGKSILVVTKIMEDIVLGYGVTRDPYIPDSMLQDLARDIYSLSYKLMRRVPALDEILQEETPVFDYESYDDMVAPKILIRYSMRDLTDSLLNSFHKFGTIILHKSIPGESSFGMRNNSIHFFMTRMLPSKLRQKGNTMYPDIPGSRVYITQDLSTELKNKYPYVDLQFSLMNQNPFWWQKNEENINADIVLFDFFHKDHKIRTTRNPFQVHLKIRKLPTGILKGNLTEKDIVAHRIHSRSGDMLVVEFKPSAESYKVAAANCFCKEEDFDRGIVIHNHSRESERTLRHLCTGGKNVVYICIMKTGSQLQYEGQFSMFSCRYWDTETGNWESEGCRVKKASLYESYLKCECNHTSVFSGHIFVPVDVENLHDTIKFTIQEVNHWIAPAFVSISVLFWLLVLVVAYFQDIKLKKRNVVKWLDDNVPGDKFPYLVVVFTGFFFDSGTTADVAFQIIGEKADSRVHMIRSRGVEMLQRNSQDWFIIHTPNNLGELKKIRLWHNCKGIKPHWYCQRIVVQSMKSRTQYCFIVEKWFSLIWGDGEVYREISLKEKRFMYSNKLLFILNIENAVRDMHPFVSVFTRDPQSTFSSTERVGVLASVFFFSMLVCALLHGIPKSGPSNSIDHNSYFFLTYTDMLLILASWLIATPAGVIIAVIFKHSAPYYPKLKRKSVRFKDRVQVFKCPY